MTPLFGAEVPIVAHELADPEKGTGIAMICTFGDITDVTWWRELRLPTRVVMRARRDRRAAALGRARVGVARRRRGRRGAGRARGLAIEEGSGHDRASSSRDSGDLIGEPTPVRHAVKFYERGERPLEVVSSRQWFVKTIEFREQLLERGRSSAGTPSTWALATRRGSRD